MTIIIGIVCKDSIIVASDSQTSSGGISTAKRIDAEKIYEIQFANAAGIVAIAGDVTFSQRVAEITRDACVNQNLNDYRQLAEITERSSKQMDQVMIDPYLKANLTPDEFDSIRQRYNYSLIVANYFGNPALPFLFTLEFPPGIVTHRKNYTAVGCGANLAEFLMSWFNFSKMNRVEASITAGFIIGEIKKADYYCGGPTRVAAIEKESGDVKIANEKYMRIIEQEVEKGSDEFKTTWSNSVNEIMKKAYDKWKQLEL